MNSISKVKEWLMCQNEILGPLEAIRKRLLVNPRLEKESELAKELEAIGVKLESLLSYCDHLTKSKNAMLNYEGVITESESHNMCKHLHLSGNNKIDLYFNYVLEKSYQITTYYRVIIKQVK